MKRFFAVLLAMCLFIPSALSQGTPLLYRVMDDEGHTLYLFGTIHVSDEDTYDRVYTIYDTLASCDQVALELDPVALLSDMPASFMTMSALYLKQGDSIDNYLSERTIQKGLEMLDQPKSFMSRLAPAGWLSFAQNHIYQAAGFDSDYGADYYVSLMARMQGIEIVELENYAEQLSVMTSVSVDLVDHIIYTILSEIEDEETYVLDLMKAWKDGDEAELTRLLDTEDEVPEELMAAYEAYIRLIRTNRDDAFLEDAVRLLQSGKTALIAIGAAHINGENGLVARLRELGYTVEISEIYVLAALEGVENRG